MQTCIYIYVLYMITCFSIGDIVTLENKNEHNKVWYVRTRCNMRLHVYNMRLRMYNMRLHMYNMRLHTYNMRLHMYNMRLNMYNMRLHIMYNMRLHTYNMRLHMYMRLRMYNMEQEIHGSFPTLCDRSHFD